MADAVVDGTLDPNRFDEQTLTSADRPDHLARSIAGRRADLMNVAAVVTEAPVHLFDAVRINAGAAHLHRFAKPGEL